MNSRSAAFLLLPVLICLAAGCDAPPDLPADARVRYDTVGGTVHVVSGSRGAWVRGGSWAVPADSMVVIGSMDGADEAVFGEIAGVVVHENRIYVADTQAREIRAFDRAGTFITRFGRDGEGPGEFRNISGLAVAPDGVAALDGRLARVTVFGADGEVVRSFRVDRPYMILEYAATMGFDDAGRFYDRARFSTRPLTDSIGVVTYGRAGDPLDTAVIGMVEQDHLVVERNGVPIMSFPRPFSPRPSLAVGPDGTLYFTRGDGYRIEVLSPAGDTLRVLRRPLEPRPVTDQERETALAGLSERYERAGAKMPPGVELPAGKPVISDLVVDTEGNLWVLNTPDATWTQMEWSVHDPEGRYLGAVAVPPMHVTQIGDDFIAGISEGELGVPRAVVVPVVKGQ